MASDSGSLHPHLPSHSGLARGERLAETQNQDGKESMHDFLDRCQELQALLPPCGRELPDKALITRACMGLTYEWNNDLEYPLGRGPSRVHVDSRVPDSQGH